MNSVLRQGSSLMLKYSKSVANSILCLMSKFSCLIVSWRQRRNHLIVPNTWDCLISINFSYPYLYLVITQLHDSHCFNSSRSRWLETCLRLWTHNLINNSDCCVVSSDRQIFLMAAILNQCIAWQPSLVSTKLWYGSWIFEFGTFESGTSNRILNSFLIQIWYVPALIIFCHYASNGKSGLVNDPHQLVIFHYKVCNISLTTYK